jgi:ribosomal protein S18 acetylase RimI-like enzyme
MILNKDIFLSEIFKKNFYHIINFNEQAFQLINNKNIFEISSIYSISLIKSQKDFSKYHNSVNALGFKFVGLLTSYELNLNDNLSRFIYSSKIRTVKEDDIPILKSIAYNNFQDDKFHHDSKIPRDLSNEYFSVWIENSCYGLTDLVWVYEETSNVVGFLSGNYPKEGKNYCQIILNAIDKPYTRKGKYKELLTHSIKHFIDKGFNKVRIGTYENSIGVHKTLNDLSFQPIYYTYIYHLHS